MKRILAIVLFGVAFSVAAGDATAAERQAGGHAAKLVRHAGKAVGFTLGVAVTAALAGSKKWNAPFTEADGRVHVIRVNGRSFTLKQRHQPVVGPRIQGFALRINPDTMVGRVWRNFVTGVAAGATAAPLAEARYEAGFLKLLSDL